MRTGVVVAGGHSSRFGPVDKAVVDLAGTPMIRRVADRLVPAVDTLVVNCRRDQRTAIAEAMANYPLEIAYAIDREPDRGPMAGISDGLAVVDDEYACVVACDMPFVDPAFVRHLFERARGHDAAVARLDDGWLQTTQAVYRTDAMADACADALARGDRGIVDPLADLDCVVVESEEVLEVTSPRTFENVNTPEDLERAAARVATREE